MKRNRIWQSQNAGWVRPITDLWNLGLAPRIDNGAQTIALLKVISQESGMLGSDTQSQFWNQRGILPSGLWWRRPPGFIVCISPVSALAMEEFSGCFVFVVLKDSVQKGEGEGCTSVRTLILCSVLCIYCVLLCYPFTLLHKLTRTHFNWCCLSLVPESVWICHIPKAPTLWAKMS